MDLGVTPEGYHLDPNTHHLVPIEEETPAIKLIFHLYTVRRHGSRTIAKELTRRGHHRRSGRPWSYKTSIDTLLNPVYIGTVQLSIPRKRGGFLYEVWVLPASAM